MYKPSSTAWISVEIVVLKDHFASELPCRHLRSAICVEWKRLKARLPTRSESRWVLCRLKDVQGKLAQHRIKVGYTTVSPHPADFSLIGQPPHGLDLRNKVPSHQRFKGLESIKQSYDIWTSALYIVWLSGRTKTDPVAKTTTSAFSWDPSSKMRLSSVKVFTLPFLSLIWPSMISWLAPTSIGKDVRLDRSSLMR